ncbi:delta-like protein 1 [Achroia grisella]|uniref:delta-like protein 1 n=1 Tax=Achroia grisella TaxID=688607 RepID=UPI0027D30E0D|nr:delta-like protein 1 [Achroia grisella]
MYFSIENTTGTPCARRLNVAAHPTKEDYSTTDLHIYRPKSVYKLKCVPNCEPACVYGECKAPNVCACNSGYETDPANRHICIPVCEQTCVQGTCVEPNICKCHFGWSLATANTCVPICSSPCGYGTCVRPEICECHDGYHRNATSNTGLCVKNSGNSLREFYGGVVCQGLLLTLICMSIMEIFVNGCHMWGLTFFKCKPKCLPACKNGYCESPGVCACNEGYSPDPSNPHTCLPICEPSCLHGTCIEPNTCKCDFGYELQDRQCQPVCSDPCENGVCEAPETCTCLNGFRMSENKICVPYCSKGCDKGICTNPETCSCEFGWNLKTPNSCEPMCSRPCGNGTCTRPDECDCSRGYKLDFDNTLETDMCIPNCGNCEGVCVAPGECVCDPPYTAKAVRDDGEECDCVSDCSIANKTCDRTICYIETTSPSTETDATSTEQEFTDADYTSSTNDDLDYNTTEKSVIVTTPTTNTNFLLSNAANTSKEIGSWKLFGVIVGAVVLLCCMSIIIIVIIYRKHICRYMNGAVYVVDDNVGTDEVGDQFDFSRIEFSSILRNRQEEEESLYAEIGCKEVSNN